VCGCDGRGGSNTFLGITLAYSYGFDWLEAQHFVIRCKDSVYLGGVARCG
jgi:hypothetical protein